MKSKIGVLTILGTVFGVSVIGSIVGAVLLQPEPHTHEFGEWKVLKSPTCTEEGLQERSCECNETEQEVIEATGHNEISHEGKEPTCTENGWKAYTTCENCDYSTYEIILAKGHHYDSVLTAPTCTSKGYTTYPSSISGFVFSSNTLLYLSGLLGISIIISFCRNI